MLAELDFTFLVNRWFHLAAVIVAVGGTVFIRFVLHPTLKSAITDDAAKALREALFRRWAHVLHTCITVLILSGTYNAVVQLSHHRGMPAYHAVFGLKLLLVLALFFIAIALTGRSRTFEGMRARRPFWLGATILLAAVIILLSNILKNLPGTP